MQGLRTRSWPHSPFALALEGSYRPHVTDEKAEAQRCPCRPAGELGSEPSILPLQPHFLAEFTLSRIHTSHSQTRFTGNFIIHTQSTPRLSTLSEPVISTSVQMQGKHCRFRHSEHCLIKKKTNTGGLACTVRIPNPRQSLFPILSSTSEYEWHWKLFQVLLQI